mmetsp:Transcript_22036/g.30769  ORF Transcript_22036/g.30769 Transcript_22036/m.30769 type:complete len:156 (+) Transcript_22036:163-630(+)
MSSLSKVTESEQEIDDETTNESDALFENQQLIEWIKQQVDAEVARIKQQKNNAIPLNVVKAYTSREKRKIINNVEFDTAFDFEKVQQIMVSEQEIVCPIKDQCFYVNVLLFTDKPLPLIFGYLFVRNKKNKLTEWKFINIKGKKTYHRVDGFTNN